MIPHRPMSYTLASAILPGHVRPSTMGFQHLEEPHSMFAILQANVRDQILK